MLPRLVGVWLVLLPAPLYAADLTQGIPIEVQSKSLDEDAAHMARAHKALDAGDISAARAWLQKPAADDISDAMNLLGQTYDPIWLNQHNVIGIQGLADPEQAIAWYAKAARLGNNSAQRRLAEGN